MSENIIHGTSLAPLIGLRRGKLSKKIHMISEEIRLIPDPQIKIDEEWKADLGNTALINLQNAKWGLEHTYIADSDIHMGPLEKNSEEVLKSTLLALWITHPTGARMPFILRYRQPWHHDNATSISDFFGYFHPHTSYEDEGLIADDIEILRRINCSIQKIYEEKHEFHRTLFLLYGALQMWFKEARFVMFTTVIESLFTSDSNELSHKISERVAWFLENEIENRKIIYKRMREIYNFRSKIVHGAKIKTSLMKNSEGTLADLEFYCQQSIKKILIDPEKQIPRFASSKTRAEYFDELLFT